MQLYVAGIGLVAPGLEGWQQGRAVLSGAQPYRPQPLAPFKPTLLPANERRRTTALIKLALETAEDALHDYPGEMGELASVFASSEGDAEIADKICRALLLPDRPVSPTHFHNSVHNAAAGYWAIASGSPRFSTSIAAGQESFALGLLEAASVAVLERQTVMLVAYDYPLPPPLLGRGLVSAPFGAALILSAQPALAKAALHLDLAAADGPEPPLPPSLQPLRATNPAAAALPLLTLLAGGGAGRLAFSCGAGRSLQLELAPC